jgi:hypothetical protein
MTAIHLGWIPGSRAAHAPRNDGQKIPHDPVRIMTVLIDDTTKLDAARKAITAWTHFMLSSMTTDRR